MIHLKSATFKKQDEQIFPYTLSFFSGETIEFTNPVSILVGDNGSGKSSMLELMNEVLGLYRIQMDVPYQKELKDVMSKAAKNVKLAYSLSKPRGFFFSAEDFTSYIHFLVKEKNEAYHELERVKTEYKNKSMLSKQLAAMPFSKTIHEIDEMYEKDLLKSSHGEAYLSFFSSRLRKNELYFLDEPETPLSIQNQLALLALIDQGVKDQNQFIIATHSPLLMAIPNATLYEVSKDGINQIKYNEIDSVNLLKQFLNHPESFFRHLYDDES